jgi:hypothetical protein
VAAQETSASDQDDSAMTPQRALLDMLTSAKTDMGWVYRMFGPGASRQFVVAVMVQTIWVASFIALPFGSTAKRICLPAGSKPRE